MAGAFRHGTLTLTDHRGRTRTYGEPAPGFPDVRLRFTDAKVMRDIAMMPDLGAGEAFMAGRLVIEGGDILQLNELLRLNNPWDRTGGVVESSAIGTAWHALKGRVDRINWQRKSRRNVAHHYDLDDRLYDLFLDPDRQYSCGYFTDPGNTLEQAQQDKLAHIAAKLHLAPGHRVLDIGCGWGGLALYLHRQTGAQVLGVTLSSEQLKVARARAEAQEVADKVRFELIDYRQVTGSFDRIVSVGMFEHVGPRHYEAFFRKCRNLLTDDGVMLLHTIGRLGAPGVTDAWTAKYIFPGGYSPALSEIVRASERVPLIVADVETLRRHYAYTLRAWYARVVAHRDDIVAMYDERFYRMWTFYLAGAAASFEGGTMCNYQIQYIRQRDATPITRDYMAAAESALRNQGAAT
jgi:cyclopropane-fatty-acyl-phospholipid synthase